MAAWVAYALLAAVFAALVPVLGKVGVKNVDATLATAVRAVVMKAQYRLLERPPW